MDVTKWEYGSFILRDPQKIDELGQKGWEMVGVDGSGSMAYFKRPCGRIHVEEVEVNQNQTKLVY